MPRGCRTLCGIGSQHVLEIFGADIGAIGCGHSGKSSGPCIEKGS